MIDSWNIERQRKIWPTSTIWLNFFGKQRNGKLKWALSFIDWLANCNTWSITSKECPAHRRQLLRWSLPVDRLRIDRYPVVVNDIAVAAFPMNAWIQHWLECLRMDLNPVDGLIPPRRRISQHRHPIQWRRLFKNAYRTLLKLTFICVPIVPGRNWRRVRRRSRQRVRNRLERMYPHGSRFQSQHLVQTKTSIGRQLRSSIHAWLLLDGFVLINKTQWLSMRRMS